MTATYHVPGPGVLFGYPTVRHRAAKKQGREPIFKQIPFMVTASYSPPNKGCIMLQISKFIKRGLPWSERSTRRQWSTETFSRYTVARKLVADLPAHAHAYSVRIPYFVIIITKIAGVQNFNTSLYTYLHNIRKYAVSYLQRHRDCRGIIWTEARKSYLDMHLYKDAFLY